MFRHYILDTHHNQYLIPLKFRYARHTINLNKIEEFYTEIVGLQRLGGFTQHAQYDGVFLGFKDADWHLEFTTSPDATPAQFEEDDILVFYVDTDEELTAIKSRLAQNQIQTIQPKNPYWQQNGIMIADPDGCRVVFAVR